MNMQARSKNEGSPVAGAGDRNPMVSVLFVDDEPDILVICKRYLEQTGRFTVNTAMSAREALEILCTIPHDAVVADYQMPDMDGIAFLKVLREQYPALPFLLFTGRGREDIAIAAFENGADCYVKKGGTPTKQFEELAQKIQQVVEREVESKRVREMDTIFREVFNNANDAIFLHEMTPDGPGKYILVNDVALRWLGYSPSEIMTMSPLDIVPDAVMSAVLPKAMKALSADGHATFESVHRRKDGGTYPVEVSCHTLAFNRRTVAFSIVRDITGRKQAEAALCESEGKWRTLAESTPVAIMIHQGDHLVYINPAGEWMTGYSAGELYAMNFWDFTAPEFRQIVRERGRQRQNGERLPYSYDVRIIAKDGSPKWISVTGNQIQYSGRPAGLISAVDITERKKSEDLIALTSRKLALMNDMTHQDLQNKITGLRGYVELAREAKTEEERSAYSDKEERILADIHHMIKNCKDYQEMGVNQPRWIPVEESIRIAASIVSPGPGITVESHLAGLELYADPLIEKIFSHLIDNAVRHGKTTTHIRFLCEPTNEGVLLICEDDGAGIPETKKKNLFQRGTGSAIGFGLFFVRECLEINGMKIAELSHPGNGARFGITVPNGMYRCVKPT